MTHCRRLATGLCAAIVIVFTVSGSAVADLDGVKAALQSGDNKAALDELMPLAEQQDAEAQVLLGDLYYQGIGVPANYSLAWTWYNRAAGHDNAEGQYKLGKMLWDGVGVPRNDDVAVEWYEKAAENGSMQARIDLGYIYRDGRRGILASPTKALKYFRMAADQGSDEALIAIEEMLASGVAPPEALAEYEAEQDTLSLSETERIEKAVGKWLSMFNRFGGGEGQPQVVVTEAEDTIEVVLPDLVLTPIFGTDFVLGTVRAVLHPIGELPDDPDQDIMEARRYQVELELPGRIGIRDGGDEGELTFQVLSASGLWLPTISNFVQTDFSLADIALTDPDGNTLFNAAGLRWYADLQESVPGLWGGPSGFEISGLSVQEPGGPTRVILARLYAETVMTDIQLEGYYALARKYGLEPGGFSGGPVDIREDSATIVDYITSFITSTTFTMGIEGLDVYDDDKSKLVSIDSMSFASDTRQESPKDVEIRLRYRHQGLDAEIPEAGPLGGLIPSSVSLELSARQLPLEQMIRNVVDFLGLTVAMESGVELTQAEQQTAQTMMFEIGPTMMTMLEQAQAKLGIDIELATALSVIALSGEVGIESAAIYAATGNFDLSVSDVPALLALVEGEPQLAEYGALVKVFADIAEYQPNDPTARFAIAINADGTVMVNGQDAMAMSVDALVE